MECAQQILSFDASMGWDAARRSQRAGALEIDDKHARCALSVKSAASSSRFAHTFAGDRDHHAQKAFEQGQVPYFDLRGDRHARYRPELLRKASLPTVSENGAPPSRRFQQNTY